MENLINTIWFIPITSNYSKKKIDYATGGLQHVENDTTIVYKSNRGLSP